VPTNSTDYSGSFDMTAATKCRAEFYKATTEVVAELWEQASLEDRSLNGDGFSSPPRRSTAPAASDQKPSVHFDSPANQYYKLGPSFDSLSSSGRSGTLVDDRKQAAKLDVEDDHKPAAKPDAGRRSCSPAFNDQSSSSRSDDGSQSSGGSSTADGMAYGDLI
jgi:hypothetical protein